MNNIDVRSYIVNNFKDDSVEEIQKSIDSSIESRSDDPLIGLGVLFEVLWNTSNEEMRNSILSNIKKGLTG